MAYQQVYFLEDCLEDEEGRTIIEKGKIQRLLQQGQEYNLIYFARRSHYMVLENFPTPGEEQAVLSDSELQGPLERQPFGYDRYNDFDNPVEKNIFRCIPVQEMPDKFVPIEYYEYGLREDKKYRDHLRQSYWDSLNRELIKNVGKGALQRLRQWGITLRQEEAQPAWSVYSQQLEETMLSFEYAETEPYPQVLLKIYGPRGATLGVIRRLGLSQLEAAVTSPAGRRVALQQRLQKGFSYDLPLEEINTDDIDGDERVIL